VAATLSRYAAPVPSPISVNMFGVRFTSDDQKRSKKGQPPQSTARCVARRNSTPFERWARDARRTTHQIMENSRTGSDNAALTQKRRSIAWYSGSASTSAENIHRFELPSRRSGKMPDQPEQPPMHGAGCSEPFFPSGARATPPLRCLRSLPVLQVRDYVPFPPCLEVARNFPGSWENRSAQLFRTKVVRLSRTFNFAGRFFPEQPSFRKRGPRLAGCCKIGNDIPPASCEFIG